MISNHFVASSPMFFSPHLQFRRGGPPLQSANDNNHGFSNEVLLRAALRHFAEYGLGAAEQARLNAERAFFAGDRADYGWWLEICRALDKRMAAAIAAHRRPRRSHGSAARLASPRSENP